jgi:hypothetical protein
MIVDRATDGPYTIADPDVFAMQVVPFPRFRIKQIPLQAKLHDRIQYVFKQAGVYRIAAMKDHQMQRPIICKKSDKFKCGFSKISNQKTFLQIESIKANMFLTHYITVPHAVD